MLCGCRARHRLLWQLTSEYLPPAGATTRPASWAAAAICLNRFARCWCWAATTSASSAAAISTAAVWRGLQTRAVDCKPFAGAAHGRWGCQVLPARQACCCSQVRGGEVGGAGASQHNLACHHMSLCRGSSTYGRLGYGEMGNPGSPVAVAGGHSFVSITAGQEETFGVLPNGTGMAWVRRAGGPEASH